MGNKELNTEQTILQAAEEEFLDKGYGNAKMMAIAKRANVSHSMLHYYFRTKENLFQKIFLDKIKDLVPFVEDILNQNLSFEDTLRKIMEYHFDFVAQNPRLPHFILSEILSNADNRHLLLKIAYPKVQAIFVRAEEILSREIQKGTIHPISVQNLTMNVTSLNISSFIVLPLLKDLMPDSDNNAINVILEERKKSNVEFVLNAVLKDYKPLNKR